MMRVVLDARTATPHFPGIGRYVASLAQRLAAYLPSGDRLELLSPPEHALPIQTTPGLRFTPSAVSPFSIVQQWRIPHQLRQSGADLYHSPYYLMPYRPGVPTVLTVYDLIPLLFPQTVSAQARLLFRLAMILALRASQEIIAISDATRQDTIQRFPGLKAEQVTTIPLAAGPQFRPQPAVEQERVRKSYHLPEDFVLYFGINKPHKNLVRLLQAWDTARRELPGNRPQLVVAGAWDERYPQPLKEAEALELGSEVRFLGPVREADLPGLYSAAKLFVFPSIYEGFGLPVLEALACGTAVTCANRSSLPEVAGEAAHYFDPLQVESIRMSLVACLTQPERLAELRSRAPEQAARFSWERTAKETVVVYHRAVEYHRAAN